MSLPVPTSVYRSLLSKINRILDIIEALLATPPPLERWPDWLERITAILAQYETVTRDLSKPILGETLLLPGMAMEASLPPEHIPNVLLRTKLAPEVEDRLREVTSVNETREASSRLWAVISQIMAEGAESLRKPTKGGVTGSSSNSGTGGGTSGVLSKVTSEDEQLVRAIRQFYTLCT